jgi:peptide/nickel transport system ATP-binding protein
MARALTIENLTVTVEMPGGEAPVLENLSLYVEKGKTLALVGESGCGKSMTALAIMRLMPELFAIKSGRIWLEDVPVSELSDVELRKYRGNRMSMIFQEPMTALNPLYTVGNQISESLMLHQGLSRGECRKRVIEMLGEVQIPVPEARIDAYPHQLSGGMRQRVMIVMALACRPRLLIADEPTTALDVTVQAQIFDLLQALQRDSETAIMLITHDLLSVADIAHDVAVLYAGRCIEKGSVAQVLGQPLHPYAIRLIASVPHLRIGKNAGEEQPLLAEIPGMVPGLGKRSRLCMFAPRCNQAGEKCRAELPPLADAGGGHLVACWYPGNGSS